METENSDQPPDDDSLEAEIVEQNAKGGRLIPKNRWQAFNNGFKWGSSVGMYIGVALTFSWWVMAMVFTWYTTGRAIISLPDVPHHYSILEGVSCWFIFSVVIFMNASFWLVVLMLLFGAPGGLIMGLIEIIRFRKLKPLESCRVRARHAP